MQLCDTLTEGEQKHCDSKEDSDSVHKNVQSKYYNSQHEDNLKRQMLYLIFNFDVRKGWVDASTKDTYGINIPYHYRFISSTSYQMIARMMFNLKCNDIYDYYNYLEAGYNDDDMSWLNSKSTNKMLKMFDKDHQIMYNKGSAGFLNHFISQRDTCYMRTRFKESSYKFKQTKYDIVGSLNYSVKENHPFYYPLDLKCVRVNMKYRGFVLVYNKEFKRVELFYVAYFDIKGSIPQWFQKLGLNSIGSNYAKQFKESCLDKMKSLKQRRKKKQREQLESWLTDTVGLPEYIDIFIQNGFEDLAYLKYDLCEQDLCSIGIKLLGHQLKIMSEIRKL
eukprot:139_1